MSALDDLIKAAEDGARPWREPDDSNWPYARFALEAFDGSLDAALRLHEALLPGWRVLQLHQFEVGHWLAQVYQPQDEDYPKWTPYPKAEATSDVPARSWLLAILRALKAQEGRE